MLSKISACSVFQPVTQGNVTGYLVHYNGTIMTVNSSTTTLTFTAPSLPDGVFTGIVVVMVTAVSSIGEGPVSDPANAIITGKHPHTYVCKYSLVCNNIQYRYMKMHNMSKCIYRLIWLIKFVILHTDISFYL